MNIQMDKRKLIIIGLGAIALIFFLISLQAQSAKQSLEQERDELKKENIALSQKMDEAVQSSKRLENKAASLNKDLERVSREREDIQKKYDMINREKYELIEKLKERPAAAGSSGRVQATTTTFQAQTTTPVAGDSYWGGILKAKTDLELQLQSIRAELKTAQINNEQLQREKSTLELEIGNLTRQNTDLKKDFEYNQKIMDSLTQELVREKNDKFDIQNRFKALKSENQVFRRQLKSINERKVNLEKKVAKLQAKNTEIESNLTRTQTFVKEKMLQMDKLQGQLETGGEGQAVDEKKESVELSPIVVRPKKEISPAATGALSGKIILVNKESNFVIVDLGEETGIKLGDSFEVYRDGNAIASIEVIQIRKNISACDIRKEITPIKPGDVVR
jgi:chromosome segregation ATPase